MTRTDPLAERLERFVLVAAGVSLAAMTIFALWIVQSDAIDIRGMEMNVVFTIQKFLLTGKLYTPPDAPPFDITQYGPLYYLCVAGLAKLFRISGDDPIAVARLARAFSTVVAGAVAVVCYRFLRAAFAVNRQTSFIATAFIVAATSPWYFSVRVDGLATLFTLSAVFLLLKTSDAAGSRDNFLVAAVICAFASLLTKQNSLVGLALVGLFIVSQPRPRRIAVAAATLIGLTVVAAAVMPLLGTAFKANLVGGVDNGFALRAGLVLAYGPLFYWFAAVAAASIAVSLSWLFSRTVVSRRIVAFGVIAALATSLVSALKRGAAENYFNEFIIFSVFAIVGGFFARDADDNTIAARNPRPALAVCLYLVAFFAVRTSHELYTTYLYHRTDTETRLPSEKGPMGYVRRSLGPGRTAIGFGVGLNNFIPRSALVPQQEVAAASYWRHIFDYRRFKEEVASGNLQFVVVRNDDTPRPYLGATFESFVAVRRFATYTVYEFKGTMSQ